jgi:transposase InsO family protein
LGKQVKEMFLESRRRYGSRRMTAVLQKKGIKVGRHLVRKLLKENGLRQSMSGTGNSYDNAQAESFLARYKTELMENGMFEDIEQGKSETFSYIEGFYNRVRIHSGLGNLSLEEFEKKLENEQIIQKERAG